MPNEETFPIPLKCNDVLQESRSDDYWNVDVDRSLSDSWTGFTKFAILNAKLPKGDMWSGRRLTNIQATTRPNYLSPEIWAGMSNAAQRKEKQQWAIDKAKLGDARKLRGICFIDPHDGELKETIRNKRMENVGDTD